MAVPKVQLFRPDETVKFVEPLPVGPGRLHKLFDGWLTKLVPSEVSGLKGLLETHQCEPFAPLIATKRQPSTEFAVYLDPNRGCRGLTLTTRLDSAE